ncbi:hypothetical protein AAF712_016438 [Marasmius tenuissimus]|uniref:Dehydrin n=1 Tax=Marasmius tenuissimus TaxID=585030 RepID=A0ABR2Z6R1_9AGAR
MSSAYFSNARNTHIDGGAFNQVFGDQANTTTYDCRDTKGSYNTQSIHGSHNTQSIAGGSYNDQRAAGNSNRQNIAERIQHGHVHRDSAPVGGSLGGREEKYDPDTIGAAGVQHTTPKTDNEHAAAKRGKAWRRWLFGNWMKGESRGAAKRRAC